jgi:hypothetical protein
VRNAIVTQRDEFFPHLDVEDAKVIPVFVEAIPPKDSDRLDNKALKSIANRSPGFFGRSEAARIAMTLLVNETTLREHFAVRAAAFGTHH